MSHFFHFSFLLAFSFAVATETVPLDEAQVFEWWDNGIIDADEAHEILDLLEEGNTQEACILAEVYALESCTPESEPEPKKATSKKQKPAKTKKSAKDIQNTPKRPSLVPHGYIEWKGRTDSLGQLESQRTEIRLNFYRYSLKLGSQSLLTYKNTGSESHFGQISTKEIHSVIPIDTLWGTTMQYRIGTFQAGALLDTAATIRLNMGIIPGPNTELQFALWRHRHPTDSVEKHSFSAQAKSRWGNFSVWWIPETGDLPLMKLQLRHREKMDHATLAWNADAYMHEKTLPLESHLNSTIATSRFWGSQTISATLHDSWKSKFTANARTIIPLENDTSKTRIKATAESGPDVLRGVASITCLSAEEDCRQKDLSFKAQAAWGSASHQRTPHEQFTLSGKVRAWHTKGKGFGAPLYEAKASYAVDAFNNASVAVTIPKGAPRREFQLRSSTEIGNEFFLLSLSVTFRRTAEEPIHPLHAAIKAKVSF